MILECGLARVDITPPLSAPFLTSSGAGTSAPYESVHDPLHARALVAVNQSEALVIVSVDSLGFDNDLLGPGRDFTAEVRARITQRIGTPPHAVMIASTHSHSAPETLDLSDFRAAPGAMTWLESTMAAIADCVARAFERRRRARVSVGAVSLPGWAHYRRLVDENGRVWRQRTKPPEARIVNRCPTDDAVTVVRIDDANDGGALGHVVHFTAHPVFCMLLPHVSADYPGVVCGELERDPGGVCLFLNGACGNVNSPEVSTGFAPMERWGRRLARAAREARRTAEPLSGQSLRAACETLLFDQRPVRPLEELERLWRDAESRGEPAGALFNELRLARKQQQPNQGEVQVLALGDLALVGAPGEAFVETGLAVAAASPFRWTRMVGYANDWIGYIPTPEAFDQGGYEVNLGPWSRLTPTAEPLLRRRAVAILRAMHGNR